MKKAKQALNLIFKIVGVVIILAIVPSITQKLDKEGYRAPKVEMSISNLPKGTENKAVIVVLGLLGIVGVVALSKR